MLGDQPLQAQAGVPVQVGADIALLKITQENAIDAARQDARGGFFLQSAGLPNYVAAVTFKLESGRGDRYCKVVQCK